MNPQDLDRCVLDASSCAGCKNNDRLHCRFVSGAVLTAEVSRLTRVASNHPVDSPKRIAAIETLQDCKRRKQVFEESHAVDLPYYLSAIRNAICEDSALARALSEQEGRSEEAMLATIRVKVMKKEIREREGAMRAKIEALQAKLTNLNNTEESIRTQLAEVEDDEDEPPKDSEGEGVAGEVCAPLPVGTAEAEIRKLEEMGQISQAKELRRIRDQARRDATSAREAHGEAAGLTENQKKRERKKKAKACAARVSSARVSTPSTPSTPRREEREGVGDSSGQVNPITVGAALEEQELPDMVAKLAKNLSHDPEVLRQLLASGELSEELMAEVTLRGVQEVAKNAPDAKSAVLLERMVSQLEGSLLAGSSLLPIKLLPQGMPAGGNPAAAAVVVPSLPQEDPVAAKAAMAAMKGQIAAAETEEEAMQEKKEALRLKMERKKKRFEELQRQREQGKATSKPAPAGGTAAAGGQARGERVPHGVPGSALEPDLDLD